MVGKLPLLLDDFYSILYEQLPVGLEDKGILQVQESYHFLEDYCKDKIIYGINTGFGPMAKYKISEKDQVALQYNLIRSHCTGSGQKMEASHVLSIMVARLNSLMLGKSGIHENVVALLKEMINHQILPHIYEHGGVGASGDLVQLAHLSLALIGEGMVDYNQKSHPTKEVFDLLGLKPIAIHFREGLALVNGTSAMTGIGMMNLIKSNNLLQWSLLASIVLTEIVESFDDHFSKELNDSKQHKSQQKIAKAMRKVLRASSLIRHRNAPIYKGKNRDKILMEKVQENYSISCVPQILGPIHQTLDNAEKIVVQELNSANDNPIIDAKAGRIFHGGNFHGDFVALEMDKIKIAVTKLSILAERQLNYLMNDKLNNKLPPFLNLGKLGFNYGLQGAQFTATSTVAENQMLANPMYIHSIPNNNENQDVVSMGTNAALITNRVINNAYEVLAIEWLALLQAIEYLRIEHKLSEVTGRTFRSLRRIAPKFVADKPKYEAIRAIKEHLLEHKLDLL